MPPFDAAPFPPPTVCSDAALLRKIAHDQRMAIAKLEAGQLGLDLGHELVVDLFAGGGGATQGIEEAIGRPVDVAVNHDPAAIAMHIANHPRTRHYIEDVWHVKPLEATGGKPVGLLWASPDCRFFSKAKGGKVNRSQAKKVRALCWVVVKWARAVKPRCLAIENVEEFQYNCRLRPDGKPDFRFKGEYFRKWVGQLRKLGYNVDWRVMVAADYGAPTIRKRLFIVARRDKLPIVWPEPTHGPGCALPYRTAAECIDWQMPVQSIFDRKQHRNKRKKAATKARKKKGPAKCPVTGLAVNTCRRIAKGIVKYVLSSQKPFIVTVNHSGNEFRGHGVDEPMKTITAARDAHGLVKTEMQPAGATENTPFLVEYHSPKFDGDDRTRSVEEPLQTQTTEPRFGLVTPFIFNPNHTAENYPWFRGQGVDMPLKTMTSQPSFAKVDVALAPVLLAIDNQSSQSGHWDARKPLNTITTENRCAVATPVIVRTDMHQSNAGCAYSAEEPLRTVTSSGGMAAVVPSLEPVASLEAGALIQTGYGEREGQEPRALDPCKPLGTVVSGGGKHAAIKAELTQVGAPVLITNTSGHAPSSMEQPVPTLTSGQQQFVATAFIERQFSNSEGNAVDAPLGTSTCANKSALVVAEAAALDATQQGAFIVGAGGPAYQGKPRTVDAPTSTITTENHRALVTAEIAAEGKNSEAPMSAAAMMKFRGQSPGSAADAPMPTITSGAGAKRPAGHAHALGVLEADLAPADGPARAACLIKYYRDGGQDQSVEEPIHTVTTHARMGVVEAEMDVAAAAYMAQHNGGMVGHAMAEPVSTLTAKGCNQQLVTAHISNFYGSNTCGGEGNLEKPLTGITAQGNHQALVELKLQQRVDRSKQVAWFLQTYYTPGKRDPKLSADALNGVVIIDGIRYQITDIGMRMLAPKELFKAQGFPDDYVTDIECHYKTESGQVKFGKLPQSEKVAKCGNSVSPPMAKAIIRANFSHENAFMRRPAPNDAPLLKKAA